MIKLESPLGILQAAIYVQIKGDNMKNILKLIIAIFVIGTLSMPIQAKAITVKSQEEKTDSTQELIKKFPKFKQSLKKHTTGKLVGKTETYIKLTPKENVELKEIYTTDTIKEDFEVNYYTKEEFEKEFKESNFMTRSISEQETTPCDWIKVDLEVYYGTSCDYMAYNFCS